MLKHRIEIFIFRLKMLLILSLSEKKLLKLGKLLKQFRVASTDVFLT